MAHDTTSVDEWRNVTPRRPPGAQPALDTRSCDSVAGTRGPTPPVRMCLAVTLVASVLALLPGRSAIPPLVESDYCYLLTAADRLYEGHGLTATPPIAPLQPWEWRQDWAFLTQWPMGYPLLVCVVRWVFGLETLQACQWIAVLACATALVSWFVWVKACVPHGITGVMLATVAAGCAASTADLLNPSTDIILVALLPIVLMLAARAAARGGNDPAGWRAAMMFVTVGLLSGGLFWFRYAALFVLPAVGLFFIFERLRGSRVSVKQIACFATAGLAPIVTLVLVNRAYGASASVQEQFNLGHGTSLGLPLDQLVSLWVNFTKFGFYDYHRYSQWIMSLWPLVMVAIGLCFRSGRGALRSFFALPGVMLSVLTVGALFAMLIGVTAMFGDKYDYISLERYYVAVKPLYFVLFVAPLTLIPKRVVRVGLCAVLLVASSWLVRQEWSRPFARWQRADRPVTPYGQWACCFGPRATELYQWLGGQVDDELIIVSNFHEYIALETGIAALPIPPDIPTLTRWVDRVCAARGVSHPRVLFILDHDNRWRDYWIDLPERIIQAFNLSRCSAAPPGIAENVYCRGPTLAGSIGDAGTGHTNRLGLP